VSVHHPAEGRWNMTSSPGRVALVTGASRGLGAVLADLLAGEGFDLVLDARDPAELGTFCRRLGHWQRTVRSVPGDVTDPHHRAELEHMVDGFGRLDLLVNNASDLGVSPLVPLLDLPLPDLRRVLETNLIAPWALIRDLRPALARSEGLVVNISSDAAVGGYPGWGAYGSSKAALDLLSRTLSAELQGSGISVVSVDPGDMRTRMHQSAYPGQDISDRPLPEVTLPFWAWLLSRPAGPLTGRRFQAQSERWEELVA
jgi:NAD(P)-dependent dehydrogenase (short-subunit alcohol dehydrogenase family)